MFSRNHHNLVSIDFELLKVYLNTATITDNNGKVIKRLACRTTNFKPTESSKLYFGLAIFLKPVFKKRQENLKSTNNKLRNKIIELNNGYLKYKVPGNKDVTFQTSLYSDMTFYRVLGSKSWWMRYAWLRYSCASEVLSGSRHECLLQLSLLDLKSWRTV